MNALPASIEAYLLEAGFSGTEILILKRLLENDALTMRELSAKTGKGAGVLDLAMRKLVQKEIVMREQINGLQKFTLTSLQSVVKWLSDDVRAKREIMLRRHQDFESFIATVRQDKRRPGTQYYEGLDGIKQAYEQLLQYGKEMVMYVPVQFAPEEDPLHAFREQYFRERRSRSIFARVIAHDTPLGRRYQSRDPFEYRETILVSEQQYPFNFEKIVVGNVVACFNHIDQRACIVQYPEMATMERIIFDGLWYDLRRRQKESAPASSPPSSSSSSIIDATPVAPPASVLNAKIRSGLREFFFSKKSLGIFAVFALLSAVITFGLYQRNVYLNVQRIRDESMGIAATGALQIDAKDLEQLQREEDWKKPEWDKVVNQLKDIREQNKNILFVYIFRPSKTNPKELEFVADSHSINPYANSDSDPGNNIDTNHDGVIDKADVLQWPGQSYPSPPPEAFLVKDSPSSSPSVYSDQWGAVITGYAPLKNASGSTVGVLAIDVSQNNLDSLVQSTFSIGLYFIAFFLVFVLVWLVGFHWSLWMEFWQLHHIRNTTTILLVISFFAFGATYGLFLYNRKLLRDEIGNRLMAIVATAAPTFDPDDLNKLHWARDMKTVAYQRVFNKLVEMRKNNSNIRYVWILRPTKDKNLFEWVADADSNYFLPFWEDNNSDGLEQSEEYSITPGLQYYVPNSSIFVTGNYSESPQVEPNDYSDQWGTFISVSAPIKKDSELIALLGVDMKIDDFYKILYSKFVLWEWFFGVLSILFAIIFVIQYSHLIIMKKER